MAEYRALQESMLISQNAQRFLISELAGSDRIEHSRLWRIGMLSPDSDDVRGPVYPSVFAVVGTQPRSGIGNLLDVMKPVILLGPAGVGESFQRAVGDVVERVWEKKILRTESNGWICEHMVRGREDSFGYVLVPKYMEVQSNFGLDAYVTLDEFLKEKGFLIDSNRETQPGPFFIEKSGILICEPSGEISVIRYPYFVQRSLMDNEGNLIYLGLDEAIEGPSGVFRKISRNYNSIPFPIKFSPFVGHDIDGLMQRIEIQYRNIPHVLCRYNIVPITSTRFLPLIDVPLLKGALIDIFIRPDGQSVGYGPKGKSDMESLLVEMDRLWRKHLEKSGYRLLKFTQNACSVKEYLQEKNEILKNYFNVFEFSL